MTTAAANASDPCSQLRVRRTHRRIRRRYGSEFVARFCRMSCQCAQRRTGRARIGRPELRLPPWGPCLHTGNVGSQRMARAPQNSNLENVSTPRCSESQCSSRAHGRVVPALDGASDSLRDDARMTFAVAARGVRHVRYRSGVGRCCQSISATGSSICALGWTPTSSCNHRRHHQCEPAA